MLEFWHPRNIKKASVLLKLMKNLQQSGKSEEKIKDIMLHFEKTLNDLYLKDDRLQTAFICAASMDDNIRPSLYDFPYDIKDINKTNKFPIQGGCLLSCMSYVKEDQVGTPIKDFFDDERFDFSKIDELIKLFDIFVDYGFSSVLFSPNEEELYSDIKCRGDGGCFTTPVPEDFHFKIFDNFPNESASIHKVYSDAEQEYTTSKVFNSVYDELYDVSFTQVPTWIITGKVQYYQDKKMYLGRSSPYTGFDFLSTTLYPDISKFPSKEELYAPKETWSVTLHKKMNKNG